MASSGRLIFLAIFDCINVYEAADFSSTNPPDPSTFFPFNPIRTLRATAQQQRKILSRSDDATTSRIVINHIRTGFIGDQESLVAVGEFGCILVWNLRGLDGEPVLMESSDFASTWGIAMSPKNFLLATSSNSHAVTIFHFPSRRIIFSLEQQKGSEKESEVIQIHKHNIPSLDFSPCGKFLASCSIDGQVVLWSLASGEITRIKSSSIEWGWLVRFVPSQQYDLRTSNGKYSKYYYNSNIEEPEIHEQPSIDYMRNRTALEEFANDLDMEDSEDYGNVIDADDLISYNNHFINLIGDRNVHLAEGAGDNWPSDSEPEEIIDNREYSDYNETESDDFDYDSNYESDDYETFEGYAVNYIETIHNEFEKLKIILLNTSDLVLFKDSPKIPFHIYYCSSESISIFDPTGLSKLYLPKLKNACSKRQTTEPSDQYLYGMRFLQNRLAMGEWIFDLGIFLVIDCSGQVFISSPKEQDDKCLDLNTTIMIPESFNETSSIIGYTLIKRHDEEYGIKYHLYFICENGLFKLYEIVKK